MDTEAELSEEYPVIPFHFRDDKGDIIFRDSLTFSSMTELRNTSTAERRVMMNERYNAYLDMLAEAARAVPIPEPEAEPEPEAAPTDGA